MKKLVLLPLLFLSLHTHAAEREWIPYKKLVEDLRIDKFYALPTAERERLNLFISIKPNNPAYKPSDVVLTAVKGSERQPLPALSPDFRMALVPNPALLSNDTKIMTSLPKEEKSKVSMVATTTLPDGVQWPYASVMGNVARMNQAIKKMAGALSMFAPSVNSVIFKFAKPAQLTVDGKVYASDGKNQITLKPESGWLKQNPSIVASERPFEAELSEE